MNMESRFTKRAEAALRYGQEMAEEAGYGYVGSEHLLLGLLHESDGVAGQVLLAHDITEEAVLEKVTKLLGEPEGKGGVAGLTPRTKRIIELSAAEAGRMGHGYIGTEHLLLAILREGENVA
ncbi:MAG: ATP-dependent Clp protease ATP-binding subunit ClpC, partial [Clostridia bacterium]|nr:ATP-dependent Clp protease ATP-binding subunit ClpC [Clostridia bacterium]